MIQLNLQYNGQTVDLMSGGRTVLDGFFPATSSEPNGQPISDRADVWVQFSSAADAETKIRAISLAFDHARRHPSDANGCWLYFAAAAGQTTWRSRVFDGVASYDKQFVRHYRQGRVLVSITVMREPFWEGPEAYLPLTNGNGVNVSTGINVYNCNDNSGASPNKRNNYVEITGANVTGDLPANCRIEATNKYVGDNLGYLFIGHNTTDPANFVQVLEAESAVGGAAQADATCSNGQFNRVTLRNGIEERALKWTLPTATLNAAAGNFVHAIIRYALAPGDVRMKVQLEWNSTRLHTTPSVYPRDGFATKLKDIGVFRLPPWLIGQTGMDSIDLVLLAYQNSGFDSSIDVDFLALLPAENYRFLYTMGYGVAQDKRIVDDGITDTYYLDNGAGANKIGIIQSGGGPQVQLIPGLTQRLYFWQAGQSLFNGAIDRLVSVRVAYRPRRSGL